MRSQELILKLIRKYEETLSSEYTLILSIEKDADKNYVYDDFLWGNLDKLKVIRKRNEMSFGTNVSRTMSIGDSNWEKDFVPNYPVKLMLLSKELLYVFNIREKNELTFIDIDLSSTMFGKGTFYGYYNVEEIPDNNFKITARFERNKEINNFSGGFSSCIERIFYLENTKEHPYKEFVEMYKSTYDKLITRTIEEILIEKRL